MRGQNTCRLAAPAGPQAARGFTLISLLFWLVIGGFTAVITMKVFPTVSEYWTIQRSINKVAQDGGTTVPELRAAFERQKEIDSISSISGQDLQITKVNDKVVINFAYDKQVPLFGPVFLLIKYEGKSK